MRKIYVDQSIDAIAFGGTGFIGRWLLAELTSRGRAVLAPVRRAEARRAELAAFVDAHGGDASRLRVVEGDLDREDLGLDAESLALAETARHVFHLGASFAWNLSPEAARRTNVDGTLRTLELAARLPALERWVTVGGYRLAEREDRRGRRVAPDPRELAAAGAYEASKHAALLAARERAGALGVPLSVLHVSSVMGDSRTGETTQWIGLVESLVALSRGALPVRAFGPRAFVPLVAVDFVAEVLAELADDPSMCGRELTLLDPRSPSLDAMVDEAARTLGVTAPRLRLPTWLVRALPERLTRTPREALSFIDDARYPLDDTEAWLSARGLVHPPFEEAFPRWVRYAAAHAPDPA